MSIPYTDVDGLRDQMPKDAVPIQYFKLYFNDVIMDIISQETNRYARLYIENNGVNLKPKAVVYDWTPRSHNVINFWVLLGLCILIGIVS